MKVGELRRRFKNSLVSGIAFGGGLALGNVVVQLLFGLFSRLPSGTLDETTRFTLGILLIFAIAMTGGGIGGFAGGWTFRVVDRDRGRFGHAWHSAFSFGIPYGTVLCLLIFVIYVLAIGDQAAVEPERYVVLFSILGTVCGLCRGGSAGAGVGPGLLAAREGPDRTPDPARRAGGSQAKGVPTGKRRRLSHVALDDGQWVTDHRASRCRRRHTQVVPKSSEVVVVVVCSSTRMRKWDKQAST